MKTRTACFVVLTLTAIPAVAAPIERACLASERGKGLRSICGCLQGAANVTLSAKDQKRAADFFEDPEKAQKVRTSGRRGDEVFWERYMAFTETARIYCQN